MFSDRLKNRWKKHWLLCAALTVVCIFVAINSKFWMSRLQPLWKGEEFYFETYQSLWGAPQGNDGMARAALTKALSSNRDREKFEAFMVGRGARCFTLPIDYPNSLLCRYDHPLYALLPVYPTSATWLVIASFMPDGSIGNLTVTSGAEGF